MMNKHVACLSVRVNRTSRASKAPFVRWSRRRRVTVDHVLLYICRHVSVSSCHLFLSYTVSQNKLHLILYDEG